LASDLHGREDRYEKLFRSIESDPPDAVFLGGDLLPSGYGMVRSGAAFIAECLSEGLRRLRAGLRDRYPAVFVILGNDDPRIEETGLTAAETRDLWWYAHGRRASLDRFSVYGYAFVPPTPFQLKDWERYDVSRYVDPGCVSPEEGARSVPVPESSARYATIAADLETLIGSDDLHEAVFLFHSPPYRCNLDRAALDGKMVDYVPLDVHVGSIAIRRMIEKHQPLLTLHGHVHESARLTGAWRDRIGRTRMFSAAHDGPELALVRFDLDDLDAATRELL
jgi:Icc-related predicted phosphoesterase